jgi:hypothetical protein
VPLDLGALGGEGLFLAERKGTGTVWVQSLPFSRLARRVLRQVPRPGKGLHERSILGGLERRRATPRAAETRDSPMPRPQGAGFDIGAF